MKYLIPILILVAGSAFAQCDMLDVFDGTIITTRAERVTLTWDQPALNCDNTPLTDGDKFYIYTGPATNSLLPVATNDWNDVAFPFDPPLGMTYLGISSVDSNKNESGRVIIGVRNVGPMPKPTNLQITVSNSTLNVRMENIPADVQEIALRVTPDLLMGWKDQAQLFFSGTN